jgi:hypothetical protein
MSGQEELQEIIWDVERIEHELDDRIEEMKRQEAMRRHPTDEPLSKMFPGSEHTPGTGAPRLGS